MGLFMTDITTGAGANIYAPVTSTAGATDAADNTARNSELVIDAGQAPEVLDQWEYF